MQTALNELETGVMFWSWHGPEETVREVKSLGVRCGQFGIPGDLALGPEAAAKWKAAFAGEGFTVVTVFAAYNGEDYADIPTVERTVGFIPEATRAEREQRSYEVIEFAAAIGAPAFACHIGFVPEDHHDANYVAVRDMVRRICNACAKHGMTFHLETGQEPAKTLAAFFDDVAKPNLRINFDPANMILYGTGDPIEALGILAKHVASVHAKDGDWPPKDVPGALGTEQPLGKGAVGMERFVAKLKEIGYKGTVNVEREVPDHHQRLADMKMGIELLNRLRG
jgi:sugar phosphate isomerase/epimerase